jgi:virulence factor
MSASPTSTPSPTPIERRSSGRRHTDPIPVGVIGAGNMGAHHIRTYASLGGLCELRGIYDVDGERRETLAQQFGTRAFASMDELLEQVRAVSICTPSVLHVEHALHALRAGVDVLIEKPVALTVEQAEALRETVAACPREPVVQVGHIEHFNPAVREVAKLLEGEQMVALELQRLSPFDGRIVDADVVQDLMLHDVHVLLTLAGASELCDVQAVGRRVRSAQLDDYAVATLTFADGLIGTLIASRVTEEKIRRLSATTEQSHVTVDYLRRTVERCRSTHLELDGGGSRTYRQESLVERVFVPIEEPLVAQLRSFLSCIRERNAPEVGLDMGIRCLQVVQAIRDCITRSPARPAHRASPLAAPGPARRSPRRAPPRSAGSQASPRGSTARTPSPR